MAKKQTRFSGDIGKQYGEMDKAIPHLADMHKKVKRVVGDWLAFVPDESIRILEIGSGHGRTTIQLITSDNRCQVDAIDNDHKMAVSTALNLSRYVEENRLQVFEEDAIEFVSGQKTSSYNVVASAMTIHNLKPAEREVLFSEIFRVLKKGGLFVNADKIANDDPAVHQEDYEWQISMFSMLSPKLKMDWTSHYAEDEKVKLTEGDQAGILRGVGFKNVRTVFRHRMEAIVQAEKWPQRSRKK